MRGRRSMAILKMKRAAEIITVAMHDYFELTRGLGPVRGRVAVNGLAWPRWFRRAYEAWGSTMALRLRDYG